MSDSENDPKLAAGNLPILAWLDGPGGDSTPWRRTALVSLVLVITAVGILRMMGRTWWCQCETLHFWIGDNWSFHNSQHLLDPYTFSHFQHGLLLYGLLFMVAKKIHYSARGILHFSQQQQGKQSIQIYCILVRRYKSYQKILSTL